MSKRSHVLPQICIVFAYRESWKSLVYNYLELFRFEWGGALTIVKISLLFLKKKRHATRNKIPFVSIDRQLANLDSNRKASRFLVKFYRCKCALNIDRGGGGLLSKRSVSESRRPLPIPSELRSVSRRDGKFGGFANWRFTVTKQDDKRMPASLMGPGAISGGAPDKICMTMPCHYAPGPIKRRAHTVCSASVYYRCAM